MSSLFLDSSALAKRYLPEQGTGCLRQQIVSANTIIVSRLTLVEVMSAVARRHREGTINTGIMQASIVCLNDIFRSNMLSSM